MTHTPYRSTVVTYLTLSASRHLTWPRAASSRLISQALLVTVAKMSPRDREADRIASAQQTLDVLYDISQLLGTQLDKETLATCIGMIESGVNPEALAAVIQELRREVAAIAARANAVDGRQSRAGR